MGLQHNKFVGQCMSPTDNVVHFFRIKERYLNSICRNVYSETPHLFKQFLRDMFFRNTVLCQ